MLDSEPGTTRSITLALFGLIVARAVNAFT